MSPCGLRPSTEPALGEINRGQESDGKGQPAVKHQPPPSGRIVSTTVDKDNQQELDHRKQPKNRRWSPAVRPTGPPGAETQDHRKHDACQLPVHDAVDQFTDREEAGGYDQPTPNHRHSITFCRREPSLIVGVLADTGLCSIANSGYGIPHNTGAEFIDRSWVCCKECGTSEISL